MLGRAGIRALVRGHLEAQAALPPPAPLSWRHAACDADAAPRAASAYLQHLLTSGLYTPKHLTSGARLPTSVAAQSRRRHMAAARRQLILASPLRATCLQVVQGGSLVGEPWNTSEAAVPVCCCLRTAVVVVATCKLQLQALRLGWAFTVVAWLLDYIPALQ
jgi:hypothetical protein